MTIPIKTKKEIQAMREGGKKLALVLKKVLSEVKVGVSLAELDRLAEELILKGGGEPSFKKVPNYKWTTCININKGVVHGIPGNYQVKTGDLVSVDVGNYYQGFHTDMARTLWVRNQKLKTKNQKSGKQDFLLTGKKALAEAIKAVKPSNRVGHISQAIEKVVKKAGYYPVKELTGHGVGKDLHESPAVPCCFSGKIKNSPILKPGMVIAIEVIYTQEKTGLKLTEDNWTIETEDGSLAGLCEDTVLVTKDGSENLTDF